jgi:hypothetical protein
VITMPKRLLALAVASLTLLAGCGNSGEADAQVPREFFGIAPEGVPGDTDFRKMATGNIGSYRLILSWSRVETNPGTYNWTSYDWTMRQLALNRMEPVAVAFGSPPHLARQATVAPTKPNQLAAWTRFLRAAAERYGPQGTFWRSFALTDPGVAPQPISIWQIWNEQNSSLFWKPKPNVGAYAKLLTRSAETVRRVDPEAEIMSGGMFATPKSKNAIKSFKFLANLYKKRGAPKAIDIVGLHPYGPKVKNVRQQINRTMKTMRKAKQRDDTFVTEIGWGSNPRTRSQLTTTPRKQAALLRQSFKLLIANRSRWNLRGAFWYTWRDAPRTTAGYCPWCASAGLVDSELKPKPAWSAFTKLTRGAR